MKRGSPENRELREKDNGFKRNFQGKDNGFKRNFQGVKHFDKHINTYKSFTGQPTGYKRSRNSGSVDEDSGESDVDDSDKEKQGDLGESILSPEERRLLLAQECLRKMGVDCSKMELSRAAEILGGDFSASEERAKEVFAIADELKWSEPLLYPAANHYGTCVQPSVDDQYVYTGGKDCRIIQWNTETGSKTLFPGKKGSWESGGHADEVLGLSAGLDGRLLVSVGRDKLVRIWDTRLVGKSCIGTMKGHTDGITVRRLQKWIFGQCVSVVGDSVYTGSFDRTVREWSLLTQSCGLTDYGHTEAVTCMDIVDEDRVLTAGNDRSMRMWKINAGKHAIYKQTQPRSVESIVKVGGYAAVSSSDDGWLTYWKLGSRREVGSVFHPSAGWISALACIGGNSDVIFSGSQSGELGVWKISDASEESTTPPLESKGVIPGITGVVTGLQVSKTGAFLFGITSRESRLGRWVVRKNGGGVFVIGLDHKRIFS